MSSSQSAADALVADLRRIFAERLISVLVYGAHVGHDGGGEPVACLALVTSLSGTDLEACARASSGWRRHGLATPLIQSRHEFLGSLDAFPLEYGEILRSHTRVFGDDPFGGIAIDPGDLRRACETQVKSHLVHLRQGFVEAAGKPHAVSDLVSASAPALAALLRSVARLRRATTGDQATAGDRDATGDQATLAYEGARMAGLSDDVVAAMLALEHPRTGGTGNAARLFPEYLAAVEQLAHFVDTWRRGND